MDVTFVLFNPGVSGGNRVLFEICNGLIKRKHNVTVVALKLPNWFPLKARVVVCPDPRGLAEAVPDSDIVSATFCWSAFTVDQVKGRKGIPVYYCQHYEPYFFVNPKEQKKCRETYDLPLNLISNSPWLQNKLKTLHNRDSRLIVPAVNSKVFHPAETKITSSKIRILTHSSITHFKGLYDVTLPAVQYAFKRYPDLELHLFGRPDLPIPYKFPFVHHGFLSDVQLAELYRSCDLYVNGSYYESSPLPHLEALASGVPVVCTQYGTEHYPDWLMRVPPKRPRELGQALLDLIKNQNTRLRISRTAPKSMKAFTWRKTVNNVESYFKELIGE